MKVWAYFEKGLGEWVIRVRRGNRVLDVPSPLEVSSAAGMELVEAMMVQTDSLADQTWKTRHDRSLKALRERNRKREQADKLFAWCGKYLLEQRRWTK